MKNKTLLYISIFAVIILGAAFAYNSLSDKFKPETSLDMVTDENNKAEENNSSSQNTDTEGEEKPVYAPDFTALDTEGKEVKLSDYKGKPVVINFWASWCPPCKSEMPHFQKVYEEMKDQVQFLMVDMVDGYKETMEKGKQYISDNGYTFPVLFDTKEEAAYGYGISSIPTTFFIDKDGIVIAGVRGSIDEATLLKGIDLITSNSNVQDTVTPEYKKITGEEAKKLMDENTDEIILDVRTAEEYKESHIEGAVLIPDNELAKRAEKELPNKDALILVYCRSGRRSAASAMELVDMGYTNVYDFGGIIDYPYDTISD